MFCWMGVVAMSEKILKAATVKESFKRKAQKTFDIWVEPSAEQEKINELRKDFLNESELPRPKGRGFEDSMPSRFFWHFIGGAG